MKAFLIASLLLIFPTPELFAQGRSKNDSEYDQMLKGLNLKYQDYFTHQQEQKRFEAERQRGISALKKRRQQNEAAREKARLNFIKNKRAQKDDTPLRLKWEAEQKKLKKQYEKRQKDYAITKDRIDKLKNSARKIPEEVESGLVPSY